MRISWLLAGFLVLTSVCATAAQDDPVESVPKLRKLVATKPAVQQWKEREVIRNGGFDYGHSAWAISGGIASASSDGGRSGEEEDLGASIEVSNALGINGMLAQKLHLPDKLSAGELTIDWRIQSKGNSPSMQGLNFAIGSFTEDARFEAAAPIKAFNATNFPGWDWQKLEHKLTETELKAINTARAAKRQLLLIVSITGDAIQLGVDNVSLKVDGQFTPPETPTFIAYADSQKDALDIVGVTGDGSQRELMFHADSGQSYGLCWRRDGAELAFSSTHEMAYSYFTANLFALDAKGMRRVTNPPGHSDNLRDTRKTGTVKLKVRNLLYQNVQGTIYVEGARKLGSFALTAFEGGGDETEIEIPEVVDYGEGVLQYVVVRVAGKTSLSGVTVDVVSGETVTCEGVASVDATLAHRNASSPCYTKDGKKLAFAALKFLSVSSEGGVPGGDDYGGLIGSYPSLSPVDDSLVYSSTSGGLWLLAPGADQATELLSGDAQMFAQDAEWFPDGSGLVFTGQTTNLAGWSGRNLFAMAMPTKQLAQLTDLFNEDVQEPTMSPDGKWVAAIRVLSGNGKTRRELWVWKVGEPTMCWKLKTQGSPSHPAWCPK